MTNLKLDHLELTPNKPSACQSMTGSATPGDQVGEQSLVQRSIRHYLPRSRKTHSHAYGLSEPRSESVLLEIGETVVTFSQVLAGQLPKCRGSIILIRSYVLPLFGR